jgi:hypothetical protein
MKAPQWLSHCAACAALLAMADGDAQDLVVSLERLDRAPERILPLHGRAVSVSELFAAAGAAEQ